MDIYKILKKLNIDYKEVEHKPVLTSEEAEFITNLIDGIGCKNLFLKSKENYYIYLLECSKKADLKYLAREIKESRLHFASPEELKSILNLVPGSVTPLGIINDSNNLVTILISQELQDQTLLFHPNTNTKTISISYNDLIKFIDYMHHQYKVI